MRCPVFGATVFEESLKFYTDKFSKGEENFIDTELNELPVIYPDDVQSIISTSEPYHYQAHFLVQGYYVDPYSSSRNRYEIYKYDIDLTTNDRICCYVLLKDPGNSTQSLVYDVGFYGKVGTKAGTWYDMPMNITEIHDGIVASSRQDIKSSFSASAECH